MQLQVGDFVRERSGGRQGEVIKLGKGGGFVHKVKLARWGQKTNVWVERKVLRKVSSGGGDEGRGG